MAPCLTFCSFISRLAILNCSMAATGWLALEQATPRLYRAKKAFEFRGMAVSMRLTVVTCALISPLAQTAVSDPLLTGVDHENSPLAGGSCGNAGYPSRRHRSGSAQGLGRCARDLELRRVAGGRSSWRGGRTGGRAPGLRH